jgi:hypothetical protein
VFLALLYAFPFQPLIVTDFSAKITFQLKICLNTIVDLVSQWNWQFHQWNWTRFCRYYSDVWNPLAKHSAAQISNILWG